MSKTTDWYLELEENGKLSLYVSSTVVDPNQVEDVDYEEVKQEEISQDCVIALLSNYKGPVMGPFFNIVPRGMLVII